MAGGPSHLETFDSKPKLAKMDGQPMPESLTKGQQIAQLQGQQLKCFGPQHGFQRFGKSGIEICELFPQIGSVVDDICIVRSMTTEAINHDPAHMFMNTGTQIAGRPSMGSWITYGLGSEAENLPGFVVLTSLGQGRAEPAHRRAAVVRPVFCRAASRACTCAAKATRCFTSRTRPASSATQQREVVDAVNTLNRGYDTLVDDPEIATRIAQYEMAFSDAGERAGVDGHRARSRRRTLDLYGCKPGDGSFASNCLLARRLAERGVRFIQLYHKDWDHHGGIKEGIALKAEEIDRACMALITDLKQRGMLEDTLIVWAGEFGRTPMSQGGSGRDHHNKGFSVWLAGGGIKGGMTYGATDEFGYAAVENPVDVHDLHATMLQLLGIDHKRLTYKFQGRDFRLTDVEGKTVKEILT